MTGKLHMPCPFKQITGVNMHVVVKNGFCYRSKQCMAVKCRFNRLQSNLECLLDGGLGDDLTEAIRLLYKKPVPK